MGNRVDLEMLAVLLLLTPIVSDGLVVPKCQLVDQLMLTVPPDVPDRETQVAKITCHADITSHFDTSIVNEVAPQDVIGKRKTRGAPKVNNPPKTTKPPPKSSTKPLPKTTQKPKAQSTTLVPKLQDVTRGPMINQTNLPIHPQSNYSHTDYAMAPPPPPSFNSTYTDPRDKRGVGGLWKLYGLFQLADRVACTSPKKPSFNICNLSCDKLIDDDITDDINCVLTIIKSKPNRKTNPEGQEEATRLIRTMNDMLMNTCPNMDYTQYLAECNGE
ncbi:hypothetical protein PGIGA_G00162910 [Pangasianodon gigas]|uniref:Uncharacterized protein n=1 Tax=Pangasianodon gigas TaxID=30993 RepID=A0ACC5XRR0_PANGG|nr:hypothetical protein [Pangasianodon gigas]